jgi:hypothetical protein
MQWPEFPFPNRIGILCDGKIMDVKKISRPDGAYDIYEWENNNFFRVIDGKVEKAERAQFFAMLKGVNWVTIKTVIDNPDSLVWQYLWEPIDVCKIPNVIDGGDGGGNRWYASSPGGGWVAGWVGIGQDAWPGGTSGWSSGWGGFSS